MVLPVLTAKRYVQPLREGGSLPAIVDTDDGLFVAKFRGAGQGPRALIAELITGLLARAVGLPVPDLAVIDVVPEFGRAEPDPEIQEVLRASHGVNVGLRYLDGAFNFDSVAAAELVDATFASGLVWFDALVTNPDRTHRNPNLMICRRTPWLIDHGAALYAHHSWETVNEERTRTPFPLIKDHVLLASADAIEDADVRMSALLNEDLLHDVLDAVPDALLRDPLIAAEFPDAQSARARYVDYLRTRLNAPRTFVAHALEARAERLQNPPARRRARR